MHYTYIIYYIDSVYTYVVFVQIDKYIYMGCAHVQIHTDVLEAICTTCKLLESKAEPSWSRLHVLFCLQRVNHPSELPVLPLQVPSPLYSVKSCEALQHLYCVNEYMGG